MGPLRKTMSIMAKFPEYSLVCVSPGNRITGFISGYNVRNGVERHCAINEMHYFRADMVYHVEVDTISDDEKYVELFKEVSIS
ncbi:hypothetical protein MKW98_029445 [Papaver atlanticum]|uniref:Uncharacterized protein n=1 Tax=Papaver atlanticum TaxID=357466 RepID=A0AAD4X572_9MAGN|nr:hypothetical protein MKW98_029445 [Papaver atlanticum]